MPRWEILHSERGAVMLLSSYMVSFTLLVLTTALFVRSANEMRLAEISAQHAQAFWGAEGAFDKALADLRTQPAPDLVVGVWGAEQAVPMTANTSTTATYRIRLESQDPAKGVTLYAVETTGASSGTSEHVSSLVQATVNSIGFDHAAYASETIQATNWTTGGLDTRSSTIPANTTFLGDLATSASKPSDGAIVLSNVSLVQGNVYVGPKGKPAELVSVSPDSRVTGQMRTAKLPTLPRVEVPPQAIDLGDVMLYRGGGEFVFGTFWPVGESRRCLESGTYVVDELLLGGYLKRHTPLNMAWLGGPNELCTTGPVDLYVRGRFNMYGDSMIYGQPAGSEPFARQYSPADLRIYVVGPRDHSELAFGYVAPNNLAAATLYAPAGDMFLSGDSTWMGAIIAKSLTFYGRTGGWDGAQSHSKGYVLYDEALRGKTFPVGSVQLKTLIWSRGQGSRLASLPPTTPTSTGTVICTELHRQGFLPDAWYAADIAYAERHIDPATLTLYQSWAQHVTAWMQRSPLVTQAVKPLGLAWAQHMAYEMGQSPTDSRLGRLLHGVGLPLHRAVAKLQPSRRLASVRQ